ncbi:hypothetical protein EJB05_51417, partial [Eragrostis curvula]
MRSDFPDIYTPRELRRYLYHRVHLSCECVVLLLHKPHGEMSFARVGDDSWTLVTQSETVPWNCCYRSAAFNSKDGLFYVLSSDCSIYAFDLNGPSPVARKKIIERAAQWEDLASYIVFAPWGDILHVWSSDLQEHALFLGFNSSLLISTKDFPRLKPNCAYMTDDAWEQISINMYGSRDVGIWDFQTETLECLGDVHSTPSRLDWPPPIWITPSLT